MTNIVVKVHIN